MFPLFLLLPLISNTLSLSFPSLNLTHFLELSSEHELRKFAKIVYDLKATKGAINENVRIWSENQPENVKSEFLRFLEERKYAVSIGNFNLKTVKMKVKMCFPKALEITEMNDLILHEKNRRLNIVYARCGKVPSKLIRKFLFEYGLEYSPYDVYKIGHPDLEADFVQWPTITMPERIEFMRIIERNITTNEMKREIGQWGERLAPNVKKMYDFYHSNHTEFAVKGRVQCFEAIDKIDELIDTLADLRRDESITRKEQNNESAKLLTSLSRRDRYLLKEIAWDDLRSIDPNPLIQYGVPYELSLPGQLPYGNRLSIDDYFGDHRK